MPVDSGGGAESSLYGYYGGSSILKYPRFSWSGDGSALMVANTGPRVTTPTTETSLWSVSPVNVEVTKLLTWAQNDEFIAVLCYQGRTDCDLVRYSGRILRRAANGDTTEILRTRGGFFTSANGRFILHNPAYGTFPAGGPPNMELLDVQTGVSRATNVHDVSGSYGQPRPAAVSDDGAEVAAVGMDVTRVARYRIAEGTATSWQIPAQQGFTGPQVWDLRWTGSTLHALVRWRNDTQVRFVQYTADGGPEVVLGTMPRGPREGTPEFAWRPELQRLVVPWLSACDIAEEFDPHSCVQAQFELELMRGGVTTRIARNRGGFQDLVMSPDGRWLAHAAFRIMIKELPE